MRGSVDPQADMLCLITPESRVPQTHPLRRVKLLVDQVLGDLSPLFDEMYARDGRPSIPPERLLKAKVVQALYTIRSENLLIEALEYNLLFRWFLDQNLIEPVWDNATFTKNQARLLQHQTAELFFARIVELARVLSKIKKSAKIIAIWLKITIFRVVE
jgi:transposase